MKRLACISAMVVIATTLVTKVVNAQSVANYTTTFSTTGSLASMTGSTDLLATGTYRDDVASSVTSFPSGFSFVYMGTLYTQFSVNSNGQFRFGSSVITGSNTTPTSGNALLAPMGGDNVTLASGKVHFLLTGTAPNRQFVVEWLDLRIPYAADPAAGTGSQIQLVLNESNGSIEYRYGTVFSNASVSAVSRSIFMSNGSASATASKYINLTGPAESNTASAVSNSFTNNAAVTGLNSSADGSRTVFTFTPLSQPDAPTSMSFTNVVASSMTVNWTDNSSNETGFLVERSTDGTNFTTVSTTAANATSLALTGLVPSTNYTIRVRALNEGRISTALTGTQSTNAVTTYVWNQTGSADYATATNWTPNRTATDPSDVLEFSNGATTTVTGVTTQTIGRLVLGGNTSVTLQSAATATLTLSGGTGTDLDVPSGSTLILGSSNSFTLTHASSAGNASTIAGTLTVNASNTFTTSTSANNITTVTGTVNNAGTISGATASLLFNSGSTYNHNFTTSQGTIPTATWNANSTISFTTYTTNTTVPSGIGQTFGNVTWNCASQTGNINFDNGSFAVAGTFTITNTNTSSIRLTGSTSRTINVNNLTMTGGTLDFASGSGTLTMRVFGTFNQSGGTITESSTGIGVIEFADTLGTSQNVTLGTISNTFRYIVSDVQGINLTGTLTVPTSGSLIINTVAATPINGGTLVYGTAPTTLQYGNATSGMAALTATAAIFPASSGPSNLTINNANGVSLSFSRTVTTLTMTSGNLNLGGNTLTLGTSAAAAGTMSYTSGLIQGGTFTRWYPTTGLPTSASTSIGYYPMGHSGNNRQVQVFFSAATALSTGGTISITHNNSLGTTSITGFTDGAITVDRRSNTNWVITTGDGIAATGTINLALRGDNAVVPSTIADLRLIRATDAVGTSSNGTGTTLAPVANRTAISLTDLASTFYMGSTSANLGTLYTATASGNWGDNGTWDIGTPPGSSDLAVINSGVTVTVAGATTPYQALTLTVNGTLNANANTLSLGGFSTTGLTINSGGTVNVGGGSIDLGPTGGGNRRLTVNGTLGITSGTLTVNGNVTIASGATFNQSGGDLRIDGNADNVAGNSVVGGTHLFSTSSTTPSPTINCTAGTITIVDPPINTSTSTNAMNLGKDSGNPNWFSGTHTVVIGDGASTTTGESATGFVLDCWPNTGRVRLNNVTVNSGNATGRFARNTTSTLNGTYIYGTLTINANSEFRWIAAATGDNTMGGNVVNNGTLTIATSTVSFGRPTDDTTLAVFGAQTISGTGTFRNATSSPTANTTGFTVNNPNGVTFNTSLTVSSAITVSSGVTMTIPAGRTITVTSGGVTNSGAVVIKSASSSSYGQLMTAGSVTGGVITFERTVSGSNSGWRFLSSPVNAAFTSFGPTASVTNGNIIRLNTANPNAWEAQGGSVSNNVTAGRGYAVFLGNSGVNNNSQSHTFNITGSSLNTSNVTVSGLSDGDATNNFGWTLVGNPFGTSLTWDTTTNTRTNLDNAYYVWDAAANSGSGSYASFVSGVSNPGGALTNYIPPMQAFLVKANAASPVLTFAATSRNMNFNGTQLRTQASTEIFRLRAIEEGSTRTDEATFVSRPGNQLQFESSFDAFKLMSFDPTAPNLYSYSSGNDKLSINSFGELTAPISIPVGFEVNQNGNYTISFANESLNHGCAVILEDLTNRRRHDLRASAYVFSHSTTNPAARFILHLSPLATSVDDVTKDDIKVYSHNSSIFISGLQKDEVLKQVDILDISGKLVYQVKMDKGSDASEIKLPVAEGAYIARLQTTKRTLNEKLILGF